MAELKFRNLDVTSDAAVGEWGVEGMLAAIERGSLRDWRRIAHEVRREPYGEAADDLTQALEIAEPGGARTVLELVLQRAREPEAAEIAREVRSAIRASGLTAARFAERIETSASRLSTYATGKVVPSAVMMRRIERAGRRWALPSDVVSDESGLAVTTL